MEDEDLLAVVRHYERAREEDRLVGGLAELELVRTQEVLRRHLPAPPARIVDVGGGTGVHADWLLNDGHDVHLIDRTPRHVARAMSALGPRGLTAAVGDARWLGLPDCSADAVLVLGPLYHLLDRDGRVGALAEARRVVRPGGLVAAAAISRFSPLFDGLARQLLFDEEAAARTMAEFADGRHTNRTDRPGGFTTAFFHRPEELRDEIIAADLEPIDLVGLEGLAGWLAQLDARWSNDADREIILAATRLVESEPAVIGVSAHLLAIARRSM